MRVQSINSFVNVRRVNYVGLKPYSLNVPISDTVSFRARDKRLLSPNEGEKAANKLKTATAGYRGVYGGDFNDKLIYSLTNALVQDMNVRDQQVSMVAGDTREATKKYAPFIRDMMALNGIDVVVPQLKPSFTDKISPVASPVLALATRNMGIPMSVLLTASHNPWSDGGYNFLTDTGMVADDSKVRPIAQKMEEMTRIGEVPKRQGRAGKTVKFNPYEMYKQHLEDNKIIDFAKIREMDIDIIYEDFGGTGGYYFPKLLKDNGIPVQKVLSSKTEGPNPTRNNLMNLSLEVTKSKNPFRIGLATDGDSDRFGVVDENGNFINSSDVILLATYHLVKNKGMTEGTVIKNQSTSEKIDLLVDKFNQQGCNIEVEQTPVGFKYLGGKMIELMGTPKEAIIVGEESGGLTVRGHIPEKDGFVAISTMLELMATEKKPIGEILRGINEELGGDFVSECHNFKFSTEEEKLLALDSFEKYLTGEETQIAGLEIDYERTEEINKKLAEYKKGGDGIKLYLEDGSAVIIRKSGTEPLLRIFVDASNRENFNAISSELATQVENMGGVKK